jgi:hypothetical protein
VIILRIGAKGACPITLRVKVVFLTFFTDTIENVGSSSATRYPDLHVSESRDAQSYNGNLTRKHWKAIRIEAQHFIDLRLNLLFVHLREALEPLSEVIKGNKLIDC